MLAGMTKESFRSLA